MKVGLFSIGLNKYWSQFPGLRDRLEGHRMELHNRLANSGVGVVDAELVDTVENARRAELIINGGDVSLVFIYVATYALSSTVLPVVQRLNRPVIVLNLQPTRAIDYEAVNGLGDRQKMTGEWLAYCQACAVPEIASVMNQAGIRYEIVTGYMDDPVAWREIDEWIAAAKVKEVIRANNLGVLGSYYNGMLDVYTDLTKQSTVFGSNIEILEIGEIKKFRDAVSDKEIEEKIEIFREKFDVSPLCEQTELMRAARTSVALDRLVMAHELGSIAYYFEGMAGDEYEDIVTSAIAGNTLLTGNHIPVAGEGEVKNAQAMKILDSFGAGGSFSEFYAVDFNDDVVLLGHDGPAHSSISDSKVKLVPLPVYHGKPGKGLSIQMSVKRGPVTLLSVAQGRDSIFLLTAEGESVEGPILEIGNTNSRYRFPIGARDFINRWSKEGPAHHCAIGVGHVSAMIRKLGFMLGIPVVGIC